MRSNNFRRGKSRRWNQWTRQLPLSKENPIPRKKYRKLLLYQRNRKRNQTWSCFHPK